MDYDPEDDYADDADCIATTEGELEALLESAFLRGKEAGRAEGARTLKALSECNGETEAVIRVLCKAFDEGKHPKDGHGRWAKKGEGKGDGVSDAGGERRVSDSRESLDDVQHGSDSDADSVSGGGTDPDARARTLAARVKEVPAALAKRVAEWVQLKYRKLADRYGETGAKAILGAMVLLAPTPIPGSSLIPIALAEAVLKIRDAVRGNREKAMPDLADAQADALARDLLHDLMEEMGDEAGAAPHPAHERLAAAVEVALAALESGGDPADALHALYALGDGELEAVAGGTVAKAWEASKHPRGKDGRFIKKEEIEAAKSDPEKAAKLRAEVKPEDRGKLEDALSGKTDLRNQRETKKDETRAKRERKQASRDEARRLRDELALAHRRGDPVDPETMRELIPHLETLTGAELRSMRTMLSQMGAGFGGAKLVGERRQRLVEWAKGQAEAAQPTRKLVEKKKRKYATTDTVLQAVIDHGGIDPSDSEFLKHYDSLAHAREDGVPLQVFRKGGNGLDALAQELHDDGQGLVPVPENREPGEYLLEQIRKRAHTTAADLTRQYEEAYLEYARGLEEAAQHAGQSEIEEAVRSGEEAGRAEGSEGLVGEDREDSGLGASQEEVAGGFNPLDLSDDDFDRWVAAGRPADGLPATTSPQAPTTEPPPAPEAKPDSGQAKKLHEYTPDEYRKFVSREFVRMVNEGESGIKPNQAKLDGDGELLVYRGKKYGWVRPAPFENIWRQVAHDTGAPHIDAQKEAYHDRNPQGIAERQKRQADDAARKESEQSRRDAEQDRERIAAESPHTMTRADYESVTLPLPDAERNKEGHIRFTRAEAQKHVDENESEDVKFTVMHDYDHRGRKTGGLNLHAVPTHKKFVKDALAAGKPVPASVLADYPELAAKPAPSAGGGEPAGAGGAAGAPQAEPAPAGKPAGGDALGDLHARLEARHAGTKNGEANALMRDAAALSPDDARGLVKRMGLAPESDARRQLVHSIWDRQQAKIRQGLIHRPGDPRNAEFKELHDEPLAHADELLGKPAAATGGGKPAVGGGKKRGGKGKGNGKAKAKKEAPAAAKKPAGFGEAGESHPLAAVPAAGKHDAVGRMIGEAGRNRDHDVMKLGDIGKRPPSLTPELEADIRGVIGRHANALTVGPALDALYRAVGAKHGLTKHEFQKAVAHLHRKGAVRLSGWSATVSELPDPELGVILPGADGKVHYYAHPPTSGAAEHPDAALGDPSLNTDHPAVRAKFGAAN